MIPSRFLAARSIAGPAGMALLYFATAATTVHISRFSGGVAMIWVSSALLSGYLLTAGRRVWPLTIALCAFASFVATGFFGFGWRVAAQLALVNVGSPDGRDNAQAHLRRLLARRHSRMAGGILSRHRAGRADGQRPRGLAVTGMVLEIDPGANFVHWMIGHAVGLLTFLPFTISLSYAVHNGQPVLPDNRRLVAVLAVVAMTVLTAVVFSQPNRPLMLFPVLMVVAAAVWAPCVVTTFLPCVLALIGGMLTMRGEGPVAMMHLDLGDRMQFFEIYIAVTVLFALPVQFEQERRRRQMRELAESEARYRLLSDHVSDIIMHLDADGVIRYVSPSILYVSGYDPRALSARMSRN
jgi:integral membrane sensor domain MASE1